MKRQIVYPGSIPLDSDILSTNRNVMIALGFAMQAVLGTNTYVDGLACAPTAPASMQVNVAPGSISSQQNVDSSGYGSLSADTTHSIMKQGISYSTVPFTLTAPTTTGQSVVYLVQAAFQEADTTAVVLPYYNSSNPSTPYSGPANVGTSQNTVRDDLCVVTLKTGVAATTGTQTTPAADNGNVPLWAITVANGQTTITSGNIVAAAGAPFIGDKLPARLSASNNLSELTDPNAARLNLGLGFYAQLMTSTHTIAAADRGCLLDAGGYAGAVAITLPVVSGQAGMPVQILSSSSYATTITCSGTNILLPNGTSVSSLVLPAGYNYVKLVQVSSGNWAVMEASPAVLGETIITGTTISGRLSNGFIIQGGSVVGSTSATFPLTFPTACRSAVANAYSGNTAGPDVVEVAAFTTSGLSVVTSRADTNATYTTGTWYWQAVGY